MSKGIDEEVAAAMRWAREHADLTPEQFAREVNRLVSNHRVDADIVRGWEATGDVHARHLRAAALIAEQPVSVCLGELDVYQTTLPKLERDIAALKTAMRKAGLLGDD